MSELSVVYADRPLSRREVDQRRADIFDQYMGLFHGDVYRTALDCFPGFTLLRKAGVHIVFEPEEKYPFVATPDMDSPEILMNTASISLSDRMKSRLKERFELPQQVIDQGASFLTPIIFAHELGHLIQADPRFGQFFGGTIGPHPSAEDYVGYITSDSEVNADYIAAAIMANSELGGHLGWELPTESPLDWRTWGEQHQVPHTIAKYAQANQ